MFDFLIIGGGLVGLMTARELVPTGASVAILDRNQPGQEATWAAGGILSPLFPWEYDPCISSLSRWSQLAYPQLVENLLSETGIDPELEMSGMLITQSDGLDKAIDWCEQNAVMSQPLLTKQDVQLSYPEIRPRSDPALLLSHASHIRPPRLVKALVRALSQSNVHFLTDQNAIRIEQHDNSVTAVVTDSGQSILAKQYILCGGAWSRDLWPGNTQTIDIRPAKGQMILYPASGIQLNCMYMHDHRYLIQRRDGRILVGSTLEFSGYDKRTTDKAKLELTAFAEDCCPSLSGIEIEHHWAGLRPAAPASIPYIDRHPDLHNLYINAGHFRNGIILAPGAARLLRDMLMNQIPIIPPAPFSLTAKRAQWTSSPS